jgi:hypothetical protein
MGTSKGCDRRTLIAPGSAGFLYITSVTVRWQVRIAGNTPKYGTATAAATIITKMRPENIGRALGIGLRVAGRIAGQRMAGDPQNAQARSAATAHAVAGAGVRGRADGHAAGRATAGLARGVGGFLRPFRRIGGILWLEVTGVFFLLPVVVFAPKLWNTRASWAHGPDHRTFLLTAGVMAVFLYLGVSSFWRARKR